MIQLLNTGIIKSLSIKRIFNILKIISSFIASNMLKKHFLWGKPFVLTIEPTNACNLHCPQCVAGSGKLKRHRGRMLFTTFRKIIDELSDTLCYLVLFNQGEPFLHQELIRFIEYAKKRKIYVITSTNGHFLTMDTVEKLVAVDLDTIIISLDGADEKTYSLYRLGGDFNRVIEGITKLTFYKKINRKNNPKIFLQFLVMKHNEHQIDVIRDLAKKLKVDKVLYKTIQVDSYDEGLKYLPQNKKWSRYKLEGNKLQLKYLSTIPCSRLWTSTTIFWDGTVVPCCFDKSGKFVFSNILNHGNFNQIWRSKLYEKFRYNNIKQRQSIDLCTNCTQGQKVFL